MNMFSYILRYCYGFIKARPGFYHRVTKSGVNVTERRECRVIVSLTSFPTRIHIVVYTIETLLSQTFKPDLVVLWLAKEQFPRREDNLPRRLLNLRKYGLIIRWYHDIRSFKKLIPSLVSYPDDILVTADDDVYYPPSWLDNLVTSYLKDKDAIHCNRGNIIILDDKGFPLPYNSWGLSFLNTSVKGFNVLMTGVGGVLYPPHSLYKDIVDEERFMNLSIDADDLWFWAMAVLANTPIKVIEGNQNDFEPVYMVGNQSLWSSNREGHNDEVIARLFTVYPQLSDALRRT